MQHRSTIRRARALLLIAATWPLLAATVPLRAETAVPLPPRYPGAATPAPAPAAETARPSAAATVQSDIPLPPRRPEPPPPSRIVRTGDFETLREAIGFIRDGKFVAALIDREKLRDPLASALFEWLYVRDSSLNAGHERIAEFLRANPGWPHRDILQARLEVALFIADPPAKEVIAILTDLPPETGAGKAALAIALHETGKADKAAALIREAWRDDSLTETQEKRILKTFSGVVTEADHKSRLDHLLYRNLHTSALRAAKRIDTDAVALAEARKAVSRRARNGLALLDKLPKDVRNDPVAQLSRIQWLRRKGQDVLATGLMQAAPRDPKVLIDETQWWEERRILCRRMLDQGDPQSAYRLAADHGSSEGLDFAEAEFHAGWVALSYLKQAKTALPHFEKLRDSVSSDISLGRAHYWLGRAHEALGDEAAARAAYEEAGKYYTSYYGQLARAKLGKPAVISLPNAPAASADVRLRFAARPLVRAARLLQELGEERYAASFLRHLAYALEDPAEISMAGQLAQEFGLPNIAVRMGKIASRRDLNLPRLAFHTGGIPPYPRGMNSVEAAFVYAIARQESEFNAGAVSPAGARGLMQMMPATARRTAKNAGMPFAAARLTADPVYNVTLGSTHLGELIEEFGGSYIMTIAGYNAGGGRVRQWVAAFGDPRDPKVDPVDWIERIPFTETRNYVQRVLENLQVYRAALNGGTHPIQLAADLKRGR